jgi:uncharacterized protein
VRAGPPAVCVGDVHHRRSTPVVHEFTDAVRYVWVDPDRPDQLTRHHWAWSSKRPAPMRFRTRDYGRLGSAGAPTSLADQARDDLAPALGHRPDGEVRMLSQIRHLGWLFNPITVFVVWDADPDVPVGAVLEVTNTPWKERHRYPIALEPCDGTYVARFAKELHVSPFLDEDFDYLLAIDDRDDRIVVCLDVVAGGGDDEPIEPTVSTRLDVARAPADRGALAAALRAVPLSTQRVSAGIHTQALALWRKRVPFVAHPDKRTTTEQPHPHDHTTTSATHPVDLPVDDHLGGTARR